MVFKFTSPSNIGVPDRIFIKNGVVIFIEFKQKNKKPSKIQKFIIDKIIKNKINCFVVDDVEEGINLMNFYFNNYVK